MKGTVTRGQAFIISKQVELDTQTQADIKQKKLRFIDGDIYLRANITGKAGIHILLNETNIKKAGITNLNDNKLPKGFNLALEKIRFAFGKSTNEVNSAKISYSNKLSAADLALQNAEFRIKQDSKTLVSLPIARLMAEDISKSVQAKDDACVLEAIQLLKEGLPITLEIEYPESSTVDTTWQNHIEIRLIGAATANR